jgi:hypothetical protein
MEIRTIAAILMMIMPIITIIGTVLKNKKMIARQKLTGKTIYIIIYMIVPFIIGIFLLLN